MKRCETPVRGSQIGSLGEDQNTVFLDYLLNACAGLIPKIPPATTRGRLASARINDTLSGHYRTNFPEADGIGLLALNIGAPLTRDRIVSLMFDYFRATGKTWRYHWGDKRIRVLMRRGFITNPVRQKKLWMGRYHITEKGKKVLMEAMAGGKS